PPLVCPARRGCPGPPPPGPPAPRATRRPPTGAASAVAVRRSRRAPDRSGFRFPCASPAGQAPVQPRGAPVDDALGAPELRDVEPRDLRLAREPRPLALGVPHGVTLHEPQRFGHRESAALDPH